MSVVWCGGEVDVAVDDCEVVAFLCVQPVEFVSVCLRGWCFCLPACGEFFGRDPRGFLSGAVRGDAIGGGVDDILDQHHCRRGNPGDCGDDQQPFQGGQPYLCTVTADWVAGQQCWYRFGVLRVGYGDKSLLMGFGLGLLRCPSSWLVIVGWLSVISR